jgi:GNAT superfamily N-acetyltransferase
VRLRDEDRTELRPVETETDVAAFLGIRARVDPEYPITRANFDDGREKPDRIDVLAALDGEDVGAAWAHFSAGNRASEFMYVSVRVVPERRRRGAGTALFRRVSQHARALGRARLYTVARDADTDTLAYLGKRGYEELTCMQELALDVTATEVDVPAPPGITILPLRDSFVDGVWRVAQEADADVPAPDPIDTTSFERWHERNLGPRVVRELSFVALEGGEIVGYATLGEDKPDVAQHWMTGVARRARGRGVASALKATQIRAARDAGLRELRAQNDVANVAMRRVNERLGYELRLSWIHLGGPLLDA